MTAVRQMNEAASQPTARATRTGMLYGLVAVLFFGMTLPATRLAVAGLDPLFIALGRAVLAAALAAIALALSRATFPHRATWGRFARVSLGVVLGFPILATIAMQHAPASHGGVVVGVLPLATAMASVFVAGERPSAAFWACGVAGSLTVLAYAMITGAGSASLHWADLLLVGAVISAAWGYAEGAVLSRTIGGWQVISWALVLSLPVLLVLLIVLAGPINWRAPPAAWASFVYLAVFSQFLGFFAWNKGLAMGGIARVGQMQLLQPFVTLAGAAALLGERVGWLEIGFALLVAAIVMLGWRTRIVHSR